MHPPTTVTTLELAPESPILLFTVLLQPGMLLLAWLIGVLTKRVIRRWHAHLSTSAATLTALIALWVGLGAGAWVYAEDYLWAPRMLLSATAVAVVTVILTALIVTRLQHEPPLPPIAEVAAQGESDRLEFKSSARVNMRTGAKDETMETIVAKTVCAFLNSRGGTLLLGVDDDGSLIGLEADYATLRSPDADRFELFFRDLLRNRLGTNAAALPRMDFAPAAQGSGEACRVTVPSSPEPVYMRPKGSGPELWVRVGNSTRRLEVDDAVSYIAQRWPRHVRHSLRERLGTYLLYRRKRTEAPTGGRQG
ncbi:MAG: ATP-binding protein [Actinomyces sp.]|uniref:AlbA family DNA-binding domain-containing protein n=1 Tax=Actinomyces sp. TaxID=29317 RepID=UPI0026DDACF9|nr:ATP-binding protein [Actinomyces sp.]MDO4242750.1 ATP-binding protein [Actinomyces sp.]